MINEARERMFDDAQERLNRVAHLLSDQLRAELQGELIRMWSKGRSLDDAVLSVESMTDKEGQLVQYVLNWDGPLGSMILPP